MKFTRRHFYCTSGYFLGGFCLLLKGYWIRNHFTFFGGKVFISWQQSSYLSVSFPLWCVSVIACVLLLSAFLLILPNFAVLQGRKRRYAVFCILLSLCVLPLYVYFDTARFNNVKWLSDFYSLLVSSVGIALCFCGLLSTRFAVVHKVGFRLFSWGRTIPTRTFLIGSVGGTALICSAILIYLFDGVSGSYDGCVYMFQARLFSHGMLTAQLPPEPQFFENSLVILSDKWYTQFPPGYPALLALGMSIGVPWLVNPVLASLTIAGIYLIANELYGQNIARLAALLTSISGFFLFMSSEFLSHSATLFFITAAFLSFIWLVKKKRPILAALGCGTALGGALLCRPYTTAWVCVCLGITAIVMRKQLSIWHILIGAVPLITAGVAFLAYNAATTGHPLLFGYIAAHGKEHLPGFHQDPWMAQSHTIIQGIKYFIGNLNGLNYYLFEWPIPSLFFMAFYLAFRKKETWDWILVGWVSSLFIGQVFYFFNEFDLGPRFVYETLPAVILLTSRGIALSTECLAAWFKTSSYVQTHSTIVHARGTICFILIALFLFAVLLNMPKTAKSYRHAYTEDVTIQKYLERNSIEKALVFVKNGRTYRVHYPFNAPFAKPHIYAKDRGSENKKLAEKFPEYRYFIADEGKVAELSIDELNKNER